MAEKAAFTRVHIDLGEKHLKLIKKARARVGSQVQIVLKGDLVGLHEYANSDRSMETVLSHAALEIDVRDMKFQANSEVAELFEDDL